MTWQVCILSVLSSVSFAFAETSSTSGISLTKAVNEDAVAPLRCEDSFKTGQSFYEAGEYQKAADTYLACVQAYPKHESAPRALNNAAVAYEKIGQHVAAANLYKRLVDDYPKSTFVELALRVSSSNASTEVSSRFLI